MKQTRDEIIEQTKLLIENHWPDIVRAVKKSDSLTVNIKIIIEEIAEGAMVTPTVEFYPVPKYRSEKFQVKVDEKQKPLFEKKHLTMISD